MMPINSRNVPLDLKFSDKLLEILKRTKKEGILACYTLFANNDETRVNEKPTYSE